MINAISYKKGKITFQVLLIVCLQWSTIVGQWNLYDTDRRFQDNPLQFDCLTYRTRRGTLAYHGLPDIVDEAIPYCFRPATNFHESLDAFDNLLSQKLSFEELRMVSINAQQLLSWSIPMEVIERYQFYLNKPESASNEYFYNCTPPWFGLRCQYSFEFNQNLSFNEIIEADFRGRTAYSELSDMIVQVPCYILLECHRNEQPWCLDWREVCDGNVDCFDEGVDELSCFDMEVNECSDDEYRCHNGLCISREFWEDGEGDTDCLDRSDRMMEDFYIQSCFQDPTFRCEEHSCRLGAKPFSCGDGQCIVSLVQTCDNGRHVLLMDSMAMKGNLNDGCWNAMKCLTGLVQTVNETLCERWLMQNGTVNVALQQCESLFQFPTVPVHSNHIRFFYEDVHLRLDMNQFFMPDNVCYDRQRCDFITPDLMHDNQTCLNMTKLMMIWKTTATSWDDLISVAVEHFRFCSISHDTFYNREKYSTHSSLYNCQDSSKFISKHRIMDGIQDCIQNDDEEYPDSCQLNDQYRVKCVDATKCWSPIVKNYACALNGLYGAEKIRFQSFCDGINQYFYNYDKQKHTDEFGCGNWSCNNMYARCDGFWACSDGRDEYNCTRTKCPSETYACVSSVNYTVICLSSEHVNDDITHCLGALDEQMECRTATTLRDTMRPFRCSNEIQCLEASQLCNKKKDCKGEADDESENFCKHQQFTCDQNSSHNRDEIEEIVCGLRDTENHRIKYFSVSTSSNYPSAKNQIVGEFNHYSAEYHLVENNQPSQVQNNIWPWYCNRGLVISIQSKNTSDNNRACMCPPSYYGHLCQYQNQRISLTLRLSSNDRHAIYAVISMLIDDTNEQQQIDAYDQFVYIVQYSCSMKLNRYLLFRSRPKTIIGNYSVRIDVFEKNAITYVGSWHFPIPFLFLPVNRLSIALNLSNHLLELLSNCINHCINGECVKYVNRVKYFCRCLPGWSGSECNIPISCQTCSYPSICIGSVENRSICVCPIDRYGRQCSLTSECPINACQNNGQCVPADVSIPDSNHTCICSDRFFGQNCEYRKATLDVSLNGIEIPLYLVAYFFTLSNKSDPIETIVLRKLTLFQRIITFHIAVSFQLAFIQVADKYYLAALQQSPKADISTSISPRQECTSTQQLLNASVLKMIPYRRIIHLHWLCYTNHTLPCFIDETYLCLCTNDHHANCLPFNHPRNFICPLNTNCAVGGQCLQDHPTCPTTKICLCPSCFFGNQCQFYGKGLGSTLDEILGYEFKRNTKLSGQPITVKVAAAMTIVIFLIGLVNSILSIITFSRAKSHQVGCGIYLLASSITSLFTMILFNFKFWFLFCSHQDIANQQRILEGNCYGIEPVLKVFLYLDHWLNACVALERTISVIQGVTFNKKGSRTAAYKMIAFLIFMIVGLSIPQFAHLHIFYDDAEERSWCVVKYVGWMATYSSTLILVHYFVPLTVNILSMVCTVVITAYQRSLIQTERSFWIHLLSRIRANRHILISSTIIVCSTLPYLIISIILDCQKSSRLFWFYLSGYYLSFLPAACNFLIFVLPSPLYREEFNQFKAHISTRFRIFKTNVLRL